MGLACWDQWLSGTGLNDLEAQLLRRKALSGCASMKCQVCSLSDTGSYR